MLNNNLILEFENEIKRYWEEEIIHNNEFRRQLNESTETGHTLANHVQLKTQDEIIRIAKGRYKINNERNKRSMGDFWIKEQNSGFYTPVNVKTGIIGCGSPNIVSIKKIIEAISTRKIDSYFLFLIKFQKNNAGCWSVEICRLLNLFNILDYVNFDHGTGQLMLNESALYRDIGNINDIKNYNLKDELSRICSLYTDEVRFNNFIRLRNEAKQKYKELLDGFSENNPINQSEINWRNQ